MDKLKIYIHDKQKEIGLPTGMRLLIRRACNAVLVMENFEGSAELSLTFVNDMQIKELNSKFRNIDKVTDVLSFPLGENGVYDINLSNGAKQLGDIVISLPQAIMQAEQIGHSLRREIAYLTVHSVLHLLGYDHVSGGLEKTNMREKEELVMNKLGLSRTIGYEAEDLRKEN